MHRLLQPVEHEQPVRGPDRGLELPAETHRKGELASLGIEAIEEKARDVRTFVETHEIRY